MLHLSIGQWPKMSCPNLPGTQVPSINKWWFTLTGPFAEGYFITMTPRRETHFFKSPAPCFLAGRNGDKYVKRIFLICVLINEIDKTYYLSWLSLLVVYLPLRKIWKTIGITVLFPTEWKKWNSCSKPQTSFHIFPKEKLLKPHIFHGNPGWLVTPGSSPAGSPT